MSAIEKTTQNLTLATVDFSREQLEIIKNQIAAGASEGEFALFVEQCRRTGLDPLSRQIYAVMREQNIKQGNQWVKVQKMAIQVAIDGFRVIAERHGQYAGRVGPLWCGPDGKWLDVWLAKEPPAAAKVGILRHGFAEPLWAVARFDAYASRNKDGGLMGLWAKMPDVMIAKCAEAQALRAAFPNDLSGLYASEEMAQADNPAPEQAQQRNARPADITREVKQEIRPVPAEKLIPDWLEEMAARVLKVAPEPEVTAIMREVQHGMTTARAAYEELKALGKKHVPAKSAEAPAQPDLPQAAQEDVVDTEFTPDAPNIATNAQRQALGAAAAGVGADTPEKRAAWWGFMFKADAPIPTQSLTFEQAEFLLSDDVLGKANHEKRMGWYHAAQAKFGV